MPAATNSKAANRSTQAAGCPTKKIVCRFALPLFGLAVVLALFFFSDRLKEAAYFQVNEILVKGASRVSRAEILNITGVKPGDDLLKINPRELERRIGKNPWIGEVLVRVVFPDRLVISVKERKTIAVVKTDRLFYLDQQGAILKEVGKGESLDYPIITGMEGGSLQADQIAAAVEFLRESVRFPYPAWQDISEVHVSEVQGITFFTMNEGMEIRIGKGQYRGKLWRLNKVRELTPPQWKTARYIDLSFPGQVVLGH